MREWFRLQRVPYCSVAESLGGYGVTLSKDTQETAEDVFKTVSET